MINIPSSLQNAWDDVSKDGKIDKADVKKLVEAAAPGITKAKTAEELDKILTTEIDKEENDFLANFSETEKGGILSVKNGTAKGTFEFVNAPTPKASPQKVDIPVESPIKLFEPLKLPDSSIPVNSETAKTSESANATLQNKAIAERIKKLQVLKDSLPALLKEPELSAELAKIDGKIKNLGEKLVAADSTKTEKPADTSKEEIKSKTGGTDDQAETQKPEEAKKQEEKKNKIQESNKANIKTVLEGLHDVIGNGFFNARNKAGTGAMFQLLEKQGLLDEAVKKLNPDDQIEALKILVSGTNIFNHAIAARIYANLSTSANLDGEFNDKELNILKNTAPETGSFSIDPNQVYEGMKYSLYNEKEAGMTMARGIINREIYGDVLTKFSNFDLEELVKLVDKKGTAEEKENLAKVIAERYITNGPSLKIEYLNKSAKAKIVKEVLSADKPEENKIQDMVKQMGKDVIFEAVNKGNLSDSQLATLAKHTDGDEMTDNPEAATNLLFAMIKSYNSDPNGPVSLVDINKFIDQVDKDWWDDDEVMKRLLRKLSDGPESEYAKFKALAPATLDKIWKIYN